MKNVFPIIIVCLSILIQSCGSPNQPGNRAAYAGRSERCSEEVINAWNEMTDKDAQLVSRVEDVETVRDALDLEADILGFEKDVESFASSFEGVSCAAVDLETREPLQMVTADAIALWNSRVESLKNWIVEVQK